MSEYGFDYMNYLTNIPNGINNNLDKQTNYNYNKINAGQMMNANMNYMSNGQTTINTENGQVLEPYQGFIRGNMFGNLYDPYKNYKPGELSSNNEREALLYQVLQYKFALTDLDLYLDTHPNDRNAIELYNKYLNYEKQTCMKYESMYGPLTLDCNYLNNGNWVWINSPWPWEAM